METLQASGIKQGVFFIMGNTSICEEVDLRSKGFLDFVLELLFIVSGSNFARMTLG